MRGRVMALYMAIFMGGTPVGAPIIGWIGDVWGPRWTIAIGTVAVGLALVGVRSGSARHENVRVSYESQRRPRFRVTTAPVSEAVRRGRPVTLVFRRRITIAVLVLVVGGRGGRRARPLGPADAAAEVTARLVVTPPS